LNESLTGLFSASWRDYLALCKPKIVSLIVFTAVVGMFLSTPGMVPWQPLVFGTLGIGLAAASAAAINHVVDHKIDSVMARTMRRPLPRGNVSIQGAILFAFLLGALSMVILTLLVNPLTAVLTVISLIGYGFIYSMYLKRATPQNIVIGGAAGAGRRSPARSIPIRCCCFSSFSPGRRRISGRWPFTGAMIMPA
jgi:protoheme IX farnesyltransferase